MAFIFELFDSRVHVYGIGVCLDMGKNPTIFNVLANIGNSRIETDHVQSIL